MAVTEETARRMVAVIAKYLDHDPDGGDPPWRSEIDAEAREVLAGYHCRECNSYHVRPEDCLYHYENPDDL
jgi:hypothetical protein